MKPPTEYREVVADVKFAMLLIEKMEPGVEVPTPRKPADVIVVVPVCPAANVLVR